MQAQEIARHFNEQIPRAFLKTVNQNKTQVYIQKLDEYIHSYSINFRCVLKKSAESSSKNDQEGMETIFLKSVTLSNHLSHNLDESPQKKTTKIFF